MNDTTHSVGIGHLEGVASDSTPAFAHDAAPPPPPSLEPTDAMIDLETLGKAPYCPILSIGACALRLDSHDLVSDIFYQPITLESCFAVGLKADASTVVWWMTDPNVTQAARDAIFLVEALPLPAALDAFTDWLQSRPLKLWGNSARFDLGILAAAYHACGKEPPWQHWDERCYRTIKNLPAAREIKLTRVGTYHNAAHDAMSQALHLRQINMQLQLQL